MKLLVTGSKGFIGKNLVNYIEDNTDWDVETFDWLDGNMPGVMDKDWVIHIGAISSTTERDLDKIMRQNVDFTKQLFNSCKTFGVNFQYSSSASLYGLGDNFKESAQLDPRTPYAWSKYLCEYHHRQHQGGNIVQGFRYFNVYGDYEEHKGSQASPITQFRKQKEKYGFIKLFENSDNYFRDFICVKDVCRVHVEFIKKVRNSGIFNVGAGKTYSFQQVADLICREQEYIPMPEILKNSYQSYTCSDNTKLESMIGKQTWITIEEFLNSNEI